MCTYQVDRDKQAETQAFFANMTEEEISAKNFEKILSVGPFRPPYYDARDDIKAWLEACPRKPFYGKVLSVNISPALRHDTSSRLSQAEMKMLT